MGSGFAVSLLVFDCWFWLWFGVVTLLFFGCRLGYAIFCLLIGGCVRHLGTRQRASIKPKSDIMQTLIKVQTEHEKFKEKSSSHVSAYEKKYGSGIN